MLKIRLHGSSILILILALAHRSSAVKLQTMCRGHAYGTLLPNPQDCSSYYVCDAELRLVNCDNGLHFDRINKVCNWPIWAGCKLQDVENEIPAVTDFKQEASENEIKQFADTERENSKSEEQAQMSNEVMQSGVSELKESKPEDESQTEKELGQPTNLEPTKEDTGTESQLGTGEEVITHSNSDNIEDKPEDTDKQETDPEKLLLPELSKEQASQDFDSDSELHSTSVEMHNFKDNILAVQIPVAGLPDNPHASTSNEVNNLENHKDIIKVSVAIPANVSVPEVKDLDSVEPLKSQISGVIVEVPAVEDTFEKLDTPHPLENQNSVAPEPTKGKPQPTSNLENMQSNSDNRTDEPLIQQSEEHASEVSNAQDTLLATSNPGGNTEKVSNSELSKEQAIVSSKDPMEMDTFSPISELEGIKDNILAVEIPVASPIGTADNSVSNEPNNLKIPTEVIKVSVGIPELKAPNGSKPFMNSSQVVQVPIIVSGQHSSALPTTTSDVQVELENMESTKPSGIIVEVPTLQVIFDNLDSPKPSKNQNLILTASVETRPEAAHNEQTPLFVPVSVGISSQAQSVLKKEEPSELKELLPLVPVDVPTAEVAEKANTLKVLQSPGQVIELQNAFATEAVGVKVESKTPSQNSNKVIELVNPGLSVEAQNSAPDAFVGISQAELVGEKVNTQKQSPNSNNIIELPAPNAITQVPYMEQVVEKVELLKPSQSPTIQVIELPHSVGVSSLVDDKFSNSVANVQAEVVAEKVEVAKPAENKIQVIELPSPTISSGASSLIEDQPSASGLYVQPDAVAEKVEIAKPAENKIKVIDLPSPTIPIGTSSLIEDQLSAAGAYVQPEAVAEKVEVVKPAQNKNQVIELPSPTIPSGAYNLIEDQLSASGAYIQAETVAEKVEVSKPAQNKNQVIELEAPVYTIDTSNPIAQNVFPKDDPVVQKIEAVINSKPAQMYNPPLVTDNPYQTNSNSVKVGHANKMKPVTNNKDELLVGLYYLSQSPEVVQSSETDTGLKPIVHTQENAAYQSSELQSVEISAETSKPVKDNYISFESTELSDKQALYNPNLNIVQSFGNSQNHHHNKNKIKKPSKESLIEEHGLKKSEEVSEEDLVNLLSPALKPSKLNKPLELSAEDGNISSDSVDLPKKKVVKPYYHHHPNSNILPTFGGNSVSVEDPTSTSEEQSDKNIPRPNHHHHQNSNILPIFGGNLVSVEDPTSTSEENNVSPESAEHPKKNVPRPNHHHHPSSNFVPSLSYSPTSFEDPTSANEEDLQSLPHQSPHNKNKLKKPETLTPIYTPSKPPKPQDQESESLEENNNSSESSELPKKNVVRPYHHHQHQKANISSTLGAEESTLTFEKDNQVQSTQTKNKFKKPSKEIIKELESIKSDEFSEEDVTHILIPEYAPSKLPKPQGPSIEEEEDAEEYPVSNKNSLQMSLESRSSEEENISSDFTELTEKEAMKPNHHPHPGSTILQSFENSVEGLTSAFEEDINPAHQNFGKRPSPALSKDSLIKELQFTMPEEASKEEEVAIENHIMLVESLDGLSSKPIVHSTNHHFNLIASLLNQPSFEVDVSADDEINRQILGAHDTETGNPIDVMNGYDSKNVQCIHDGLYFLPHPSSCVQYFICAYRHLHLHTCGSDLIWNYKREQCELETDTRCYSNEATILLKPTPGRPNSSPDEEAGAVTMSSARPYPMPPLRTTQITVATSSEDTMAPICPPFRQVYLPNFHDCNKYYICILGEPVLTSCPDNMHWDSMREFCGEPSVAECAIL